MKSDLPKELIRAYKETDYEIYANPSITLRIDERNSELLKLYKLSSIDCGCFITAYNPYSQKVSSKNNIDAQKSLAETLKAQNVTFMKAEGKDQSGNWDGEPSYFVLGIEYTFACQLAERFRQNAFIWCGADAIPKLILMR